LADIDIDLSELEGRSFACLDGCGSCCLCQPELLPKEAEFFRRARRSAVVMAGEPAHPALALKKGQGACVLLGGERRCEFYRDRPHYCRQFPFHVHLGDRAQVVLDLSCRGAWAGAGDALREGRALVQKSRNRIADALDVTKGVYAEFESICREAGVFKPAPELRGAMESAIPRMADPQYLMRMLEASAEEDEMAMPEEAASYPVSELEASAAEAGLESLAAEDVFSAPLYCDPQMRWLALLASDGGVDVREIRDDGSLADGRRIEAADVRLLRPEGDGLDVYLSYLSVLNRRDSMMGYAYWLMDEYDYGDFLANTYFGAMAAAATDLLWRSSLIAMLNGGRLDRAGMIEGIIAYDQDRLDAPVIGAFL